MTAMARLSPRWRTMTVPDLDAVMAIETRSYSHPWTRGNFIDSLAAGYDAELSIDEAGAVRAYSVAMRGVEETHLLNLTVAPAHRRQGLATTLLHRLAAAARERGDGMLWLEVRAGNEAGRALYRRFGFAEVGVRPRYYPLDHLTREDAVLMRLDLAGPVPAPTGGRDALG